MLATEYAEYYKINPQAENESDMDFRRRVSGVLRDKGKIIEAHEAFNDKRWDESEQTMTGIVGALAQALQGIDYGDRGERQIADDFAAGTIIQNHKPELDPLMLLLAGMMIGNR